MSTSQASTSCPTPPVPLSMGHSPFPAHTGEQRKKTGFSCQKDTNLVYKHIGIQVMLTPGKEGFVMARCWGLEFCFCVSCSSHVPTVPTCGGLPEPHFCVGTPGSPLSCTGGAGQAAQAASPHLNFLGLLEGCFLIEKWISDKTLLLSAQLTVNSGAVSLVHDENKKCQCPKRRWGWLIVPHLSSSLCLSQVDGNTWGQERAWRRTRHLLPGCW